MIFNENLGRLILNHLASEKPAEKTASEEYGIDEAKKISAGLAKISSYPYKEEVYGSVQEIMKIASDCLTYVAETLKSAQERTTDLEKAAEVRCLLDDLIQVGLADETDVEEKIAELMKKDQKDLDIIKEAIKIAQNGKGESLIFDKAANEQTSSSGTRGIFDGVL